MALSDTPQLVETLGEGSFAVVYLARLKEGALHRTVVLKVLKAAWADDEEILGRARDEAAMLARLQHENIIRVEQLTELNGHTAVVMEYVRGLTLDRILEQAGPMPVEVAVSVCHSVANALDAAFNQVPPGCQGPLRVVHRDIKPSNVILSLGGMVKVLDFGTARAELIDRQAETGNVTPGSPLYMAPERFDGLARGAEVDIYALGCTLYELITGKPLGRLSVHPTRHEKEVAEKVGALSPPDLKEGIALAMLRSVIQRSVSYEPAHRPKAAEFRGLCASLARRLPGHRMTRSQYCDAVVDPIYQRRRRLAPMPLDGTLDPKAMVQAVAGVQRDADKTEMTEPFDLTEDPADLATESPDDGLLHSLPRADSTDRPPVLMVTAVLVLVVVALGIAIWLGSGSEESRTVVVPVPSSSSSPVSVPVETPAAASAPSVPQPAEAVSDPGDPDTTPEPEEDRAAASSASTPAASESRTESARKPKPASKPAAAEKSQDSSPSAPEAKVESPASPPVLVGIVSAPAGATVNIDGNRTRTPGELRLKTGTYTAKVSFPDGVGGRCTVRIEEGVRLVFRGSGGSLTCP